MTDEQQRVLIEEFVQDQFVNRGMVADVAIHRDDENNPHAHVLTTVRPLTKMETGETKQKKNICWTKKEKNRKRKQEMFGRVK